MQEKCCATSGCQCHSSRTCMSKVPIFTSLNQEEIDQIAAIITDKEYKKGESIYAYGDTGKSLYVINEGKVKIFRMSEAGREQIIRILHPGDFMGELSLFADSAVNEGAEALEPTAICVIDGHKLNQIMNDVPSIAVKVIEELSKRLLNAENLIESLGLHDVEQRIADTMLRMSAGQEEIILSITKKDLAAHMGMSQETLSRKLAQFQEMGWIKLEGRKKIQILDRKSLQTIAGL